MSADERNDERAIREILGRPVAGLAVPGLAFLGAVGFRPPGRRLAQPVQDERADWTIVVYECVATSDGTDLSYEIGTLSHVDLLEQNDVISFRIAGIPHAAVVTSASAHRTPKGVLHSARLQPPLPAGTERVTLEISGTQRWSLPLTLSAFESDRTIRRSVVGAEVRRAQIELTVAAVATSAEATGLDLRVRSQYDGERVVGIGGLHGRRSGSSAVKLTDPTGREYLERIPSPHTHVPVSAAAEVIAFESVPPEVRRLTLEVPFVYVEDTRATLALGVPLREPLDLTFGRSRLRLTGSAPADASSAPTWATPSSEVAIAIDAGTWHDDRRLLMPSRALIDGRHTGLRFGHGVDLRAPEPVTQLIVSLPDPASPYEVTFTGAVLQVRGPWRITFGIEPA